MAPAAPKASRPMRPYCTRKNPSAPCRIASEMSRISGEPSSLSSTHVARNAANANEPAHASSTNVTAKETRRLTRSVAPKTAAETVAALDLFDPNRFRLSRSARRSTCAPNACCAPAPDPAPEPRPSVPRSAAPDTLAIGFGACLFPA